MNWGLLFESYGAVFLDPQVLLMTLLGATGGVLLGAIPGMTATMGVALLIPFSFGMDLIPSIGLLLGIYCGGMYGGSISAIVAAIIMWLIGKRDVKQIVLVSVLVPLLMWLVFYKLLTVNIPMGVLQPLKNLVDMI